MDKTESKYLIGFIVAIVILMVGGVFLFSRDASRSTSTPTKIPDSDLIANYSPTLGPKNAKVTIVEFSDFECPACGAAHPFVKQVLEKNKDKVRFVYRNFPLPQHQYAQKAALASLAAGAQGKYWEMSDKLFENQKNLTDNDLKKYAGELKLNLDRFNKDLASQKFKDEIQKDLDVGNKIGINATPTFFINGVKMEDPPLPENFQKAIDSFAK